MAKPCPTPKKRAHEDQGGADAQRLSMIRNGKDAGYYLVTYRCICSAWHVGHDGRRFGTAIKKAVRAGNAKRDAARSRRRGKR